MPDSGSASTGAPSSPPPQDWAASQSSACTRESPISGPHPVDANAVAAAEAARPHTGRTVDAALAPQTTDIDLGGIHVRTLAYSNTVPGTTIRANVGDEIAVALTNGLDHETSVHWHGIALRNDMDGAAPPAPTSTGQRFTYRFSVPHAGTYWAAPARRARHRLRALPARIVDDPSEPSDYDAEWIVVLDDWTDGIGPGPRQISRTCGGDTDRAQTHARHGRRCPTRCDAGAAPAPCWAATPATSPTRTT